MEHEVRQKTLRMLSNGMYVMTSRNGECNGAATLSWVSQASFEPPLIMAAVRKNSKVFECMSKSHIAAVHILGFNQKNMAYKFSTPTQGEDELKNGETFKLGKTSAPILQNVPAYVECRVHHILENGGDYAVVIMEVVEAECRRQAQPLTVAESPWENGG